MHFEVELALVMGKMVRNLHPDDQKGALDAIKGMCISTLGSILRMNFTYTSKTKQPTMIANCSQPTPLLLT